MYDEKLQLNSEQNFDYLYKLHRDSSHVVIDNRKDYIFGEDRTESNVYKTITYADKERINKIKKDIRGIKGNKEYVVTVTDSYGFPIKRDRESAIRYLEQELFLLENYYGEIIEQRIDKASLITKEEYFIRNKKQRQ